MKVCKNCNIEKSLDEYNTRQAICRPCKKIYDRQYLQNNRQRKKDINDRIRLYNRLPYYIVYLLPQYNYVGQTNNPTYRMYNHHSEGKNTEGWIELHRFNTRKEAKLKEAEYHKQGYNGKWGYKIK